ncbi:MAG TPA: cytochrome c [Patescibacteria group bacterium]|nr:cytochrome c [Patescibacteria group bacterium]
MRIIQQFFSLATVAIISLSSCSETDTANKNNSEREPQTFKTPTTNAPTTTSSASPDPNAAQTAEIAAGKAVYQSYCSTCHMPNGAGLPPAFPPLAKSDYLTDKNTTINSVVHGLAGEITVNGKQYNGAMPPAPKTDKEIAQVLTYVYNSWGNPGGVITEAEVTAIRAAGPKK